MARKKSKIPPPQLPAPGLCALHYRRLYPLCPIFSSPSESPTPNAIFHRLQVPLTPQHARGDPDGDSGSAGHEEGAHARAGQDGVSSWAHLLAEEACEFGHLVLGDVLDVALTDLGLGEALVLLNDLVDVPAGDVPKDGDCAAGTMLRWISDDHVDQDAGGSTLPWLQWMRRGWFSLFRAISMMEFMTMSGISTLLVPCISTMQWRIPLEDIKFVNSGEKS